MNNPNPGEIIPNGDRNPSKPGGYIQHTKMYQGVIPPPDMMHEYHLIDSTFPDRILKMAEEEGKSRRKKENRALWMSFTLDIFGHLCALTAVGGIVWLCYQFLQKGEAEAGKTIAVAVLIGMAALFIFRRYSRKSTGK